jgi:hypothetical protein
LGLKNVKVVLVVEREGHQSPSLGVTRRDDRDLVSYRKVNTQAAALTMVGFGSSLRMSRRRGWEDAYLDYASLRLLLTQIEAVYEEEDWKRGGSTNDLSKLDDDELGWLNRSADTDDQEELPGLIGNVWRLFSRSHRRRRRVQRQRREQARAWESMDENEETGSNWVVAANNSSSPRRNKKDKASHSLDKRGWRSPGVTDYRDELFLVGT